ncbi:hypothetical protein E2C01_071084 [Portunus trituberculatus]|uniref:Uncharacterized protein n=1 Tax=Portunus trituberculatus TaxID=210409 RepID=A0A5B7HW08_PORTR|nr:hypothetical protein [Portunus trituberculatus]
MKYLRIYENNGSCKSVKTPQRLYKVFILHGRCVELMKNFISLTYSAVVDQRPRSPDLLSSRRIK